MSEVPKVSIGMPVFNGGQSIKNALDALLAQTFAEFELIISDNASIDDTQDICEAYAKRDQRIHYIRQSENVGATQNFEYVLREAQSDFFMWAAHDDLWMPDFLMTCYNLLQENHTAMFAMSAYESKSILTDWFFRTKFGNPLACIAIPDMKARLRAFSALGFETQKDNLVYALWRKKFLSEILNDIRESPIGRTLIGTAMNEYALFKAQGAYAPTVLFYKCYKKVPPGHWSASLLVALSRTWKGLIGKSRPKASYDVSTFMGDLAEVLRLTDLPVVFQNELLAANQKSLSINS